VHATRNQPVHRIQDLTGLFKKSLSRFEEMNDRLENFLGIQDALDKKAKFLICRHDECSGSPKSKMLLQTACSRRESTWLELGRG
jgi:hypothetical protein